MLGAIFDTKQIGSLLASVNWFQPTWDLFIILFFLIAALIYGMSLGRDRILLLMISIYMSLAVVKYVPFVTQFNASLSVNNDFALHVSVFLGLFIVLFFFLSHSALIRTLGNTNHQGPTWQVVLFSILHSGLLTSVVLSFFPPEAINALSGLTRQVFLSDAAKAAWIILPVLLMAVVGGAQADE